MTPLLQVQDLSVGFRSDNGLALALEGISFSVNRGEVVALVGESGSGKSVSSLSIMQLLPSPPAEYLGGRILFSPDGKDTNDLLTFSPDRMQEIRGNRVARIFQEPMTSLNPVITCGDQVTEALRLHKKISSAEARRQTLNWFEKVKLPDPAALMKRYPHQLSGGQKQRVMIAMAMCCEPDLLICDEPTTALDVTVQKTILALIRELQQQSDMGVIFITHDLGVVAEIADRAAVMYKGRIVEQNPVNDLFSRPVHPYTKALLACRPVNHPKGVRLPVVADFLETPQTPTTDTSANISHDHLRESIPEEAPPALLRVENLSVWFPAEKSLFGRTRSWTRAVDDVSFEVQTGETLGLVGESGCGKTTLGRSLLRLVPATTGRIWYKGEDLLHYPAEKLRSARKDIQIVFQDPFSSLNPRMTIGSALAEPLKVHQLFSSDKQRREKVAALLEKVSLQPDHMNRYPHEFSGGQRQRIVIARALALNPSFIICDESVSALDVSVQAQVLNLLNDLKREFGFTVIFISHDLSVVRYISDRILVMNRGRIIESGPSEEIYTRPVNDYTRQLIEAIPKGRIV